MPQSFFDQVATLNQGDRPFPIPPHGKQRAEAILFFFQVIDHLGREAQRVDQGLKRPVYLQIALPIVRSDLPAL